MVLFANLSRKVPVGLCHIIEQQASFTGMCVSTVMALILVARVRRKVIQKTE